MSIKVAIEHNIYSFAVFFTYVQGKCAAALFRQMVKLFAYCQCGMFVKLGYQSK